MSPFSADKVPNHVMCRLWRLHLINAIFKLAVNKTFFFLSTMVKLTRNKIEIEFYEKISDFTSSTSN
jgi:hypothetical protein